MGKYAGSAQRRRYRRYLGQVLSLPPRVTWRKVRRRITRFLQQSANRLRVRWLGIEISDTAFRRALSDRFPTIGAFLAHRAAGKGPSFFITPARRREHVTALRRATPQSEALTIAAADRACAHIFDLLGAGPTHLGDHIDWHVDFKSSHRFDPHQFYVDILPAPYPGGYDIKVPWELSRCQHFAWLGQAYWFTGDEKYAREFIAQLLDWIEHNPPQLGVNWTCTMDVAIRAVNWLWGYHFFQDSITLTAEFRRAHSKSLQTHALHIMNHLDYTETLTSNHYLSNVVGLIYLGLLLPEFKEAAQWREFGLQEMETEMFKQVYSDGVNFEASVSYHRLVTELFLSATLLARINGHTFSERFMKRLEQMLEFVMYLTKPDGTVPLIGDNDNGRLYRLKVWSEPEQEWVDHRYLLAIGAVLFDRKDLAQAAGDQWEEALWLFGEEALSFKQVVEIENPSFAPLESRAFLNAGIYIMRGGDLYAIVDAGPNGQEGRGGHAHNDVLSLEIYANERTWIVDPGSYVYTADYPARHQFRSTAYHNTIRVDGREQNRSSPQFPFDMADDARPEVLRWEPEDNQDILVARHRGYEWLDPPVIHQRQVYLGKSKGFIVVTDILEGKGRHTLEQNWHLAPQGETMPWPSSPLWVMLEEMGNGILIVPLREGHALSRKISQGWISQGYGTREPTSMVTYAAQVDLPFVLSTLILPFSTFPEEREIQKTLQDVASLKLGP